MHPCVGPWLKCLHLRSKCMSKFLKPKLRHHCLHVDQLNVTVFVVSDLQVAE
jgi:hypothetical protein